MFQEAQPERLAEYLLMTELVRFTAALQHLTVVGHNRALRKEVLYQVIIIHFHLEIILCFSNVLRNFKNLFYFLATNTPSPSPSSFTRSSMKLSQTPIKDDALETYSLLDDNDLDSQYSRTGQVVCCNMQLVRALKAPDLAQALSLISDPDVIKGLKKLKTLGSVKDEETHFVGPLANIPLQTNILGGIKQNTTPAALGLTIPQPPVQIKTEDKPSECPESLPREVTLADFDSLGSPKKRSLKSNIGSKSPALKRQKVASNENSVENMILLAEVKRKAIKECDQALKISQPQNDKEHVIFYGISRFGRKMHWGPEAPLAFYKIICNMFPDLKTLEDDTCIPKLIEKLARFLSRNIEWTEVS